MAKAASGSDRPNGQTEREALEPRVSIQMITYNHRPYIATAIESVLAQKTDFPFQLVIGEDCSTDGTREIVLDYATRRPDVVRMVTSERNVGIQRNAARTGRACYGTYIAWCEGDDYWHRDDKLQIQVDYLESHPGCGLVHSDHDRYFDDSELVIESYFRTTKNAPSEHQNLFRPWKGHHVLTCTAMARKALVDRILEAEDFYSCCDYVGATDRPLFIELSMVAGVHYIDGSLATYRVRRDSASRQTDLRKAHVFSASLNACCLYLARKYGAKREIKLLSQEYVSERLAGALLDRDVKAAREIRLEFPLNVRQRVVYFGVLCPVLNRLLRVVLGWKRAWIRTRSERIVRLYGRPVNQADRALQRTG